MSEMRFGNPWHGPINGSGQISLPNGGTKHVGLPSGGCSLLKFAGLPVPTTTAEEAALGMEWRNYALMSGRKIHNKYALGAFIWLYRNSAGEVWRLRFEPTSWPPGPYALGATATAGYRIMARRFGVVGAVSEDEVEIFSGSLSWPVMYESTPYFVGFWLTFSPDGSHALVHAMMSYAPNFGDEAGAYVFTPWYQVASQQVAANAAFEVALSDGSPPGVAVVTVASGEGVRNTITIGDAPLSCAAKAYRPTIYAPYEIALGYLTSAGTYALIDGPVTSASYDYTVTHQRLIFGTYAPDGSRCIYRFDHKTRDVRNYAVSGTVTDDGTGYLITVSVAFHKEKTVRYSVMANGTEMAAVVDTTVDPTMGTVSSDGYVDPPSWPQTADALLPDMTNRDLDGIDIYVDGALVNMAALSWAPYPKLYDPMIVAIGLNRPGLSTQWRRACSPISTYDHGSYTTQGLVWHPVENTWWPSSSGVLGFV